MRSSELSRSNQTKGLLSQSSQGGCHIPPPPPPTLYNLNIWHQATSVPLWMTICTTLVFFINWSALSLNLIKDINYIYWIALFVASHVPIYYVIGIFIIYQTEIFQGLETIIKTSHLSLKKNDKITFTISLFLNYWIIKFLVKEGKWSEWIIK